MAPPVIRALVASNLSRAESTLGDRLNFEAVRMVRTFLAQPSFGFREHRLEVGWLVRGCQITEVPLVTVSAADDDRKRRGVRRAVVSVHQGVKLALVDAAMFELRWPPPIGMNSSAIRRSLQSTV